MSTASLLNSLYRHKAWANEELFAEVGRIDPAAHAPARHAAIRLLNHIYVVDRIFAAHLAGNAHGYDATNTKETPALEDLEAGTMSRGEMLAHIVTHGSYHRGGVGRILLRADRSPPRDLFTIHLHQAEPARRQVV